jgi:hypothetical protein
MWVPLESRTKALRIWRGIVVDERMWDLLVFGGMCGSL